MDQRSICLFLAMKRLSAQAIYNLATKHEQIWLRPGETPPETARHTIQDRKIMVIITWNPLGFPLIVALPNGRTCNAEYYRDNILAALIQLQPEDDGKKLVVQAHNARAHTAQNVELFVKKMDYGSLPIHPTQLISHHPTPFCSVLSRNVSTQWCVHHTRKYSTQLVKW
jgi:hypothetical protein